MTQNTLAFIWDYDGTLVDSRQKNLNVTRKIYEDITGASAEEVSGLRSLDEYTAANNGHRNWRELYVSAFGLTEAQTDRAGKLWAEYQLNDNTPTPFYEGIVEVLENLNEFSHSVVSQNARGIIAGILEENKLEEYFCHVVGYEEVGYHKQKPAPDGALMCLNEMADSMNGAIFFIGDHEVDMQCAQNVNTALRQNKVTVDIFTIAALYGGAHNVSNWKIKPNYEATSPQDIINFVQRL